MLTQYLSTLLPKIIRGFLLIATMLMISIVSANATILKITLSDVVLHIFATEGHDRIPATGFFIYDTTKNKILSAKLEEDSGEAPIIDPDYTIFGTSPSSYEGQTPWPNFSILDIVRWPSWAGPPPLDGCNAPDPDLYADFSSLCLIPSEPITKPGQHVELAFSYGWCACTDGFTVTGWLRTSAVGRPFQNIPEPMHISAMFLIIYGLAVYRMRRRQARMQQAC